MAFRNPKPDRFKGGDPLPGASDLNKIKDAAPGQILGANVSKLGDKVSINQPPTSLHTPDHRFYSDKFVVRSVEDDYLVCAPLVFPQGATGWWGAVEYDSTRGATSTDLFYVAKPTHFQRTFYENKTITLDGVDTTYTYAAGGRFATVNSIATFEQVSPAYFIGDIITARRTVTGLLTPETPPSPILWQDVNEAGRVWKSDTERPEYFVQITSLPPVDTGTACNLGTGVILSTSDGCNYTTGQAVFIAPLNDSPALIVNRKYRAWEPNYSAVDLGTVTPTLIVDPTYVSADFSYYVYRDDCVGGRVYRYKQLISLTEGVWTKGPLLFDTLQGCCDCQTVGTGTPACWCGNEPPAETMPACVTLTTTLPWYWQGRYRTSITISGVARRYGLGLGGGGPPWGYYLTAPTGPEAPMKEDDAPREWVVQWSVSCENGNYVPSALTLNYNNVSAPSEEQAYSAEATSETISCVDGQPCFEFTYINMPYSGPAGTGTADAALSVGNCALPCTELVTGSTGSPSACVCPVSTLFCVGVPSSAPYGYSGNYTLYGYDTESIICTWVGVNSCGTYQNGDHGAYLYLAHSIKYLMFRDSVTDLIVAEYRCSSEAWSCEGATFTRFSGTGWPETLDVLVAGACISQPCDGTGSASQLTTRPPGQCCPDNQAILTITILSATGGCACLMTQGGFPANASWTAPNQWQGTPVPDSGCMATGGIIFLLDCVGNAYILTVTEYEDPGNPQYYYTSAGSCSPLSLTFTGITLTCGGVISVRFNE